MTDGSAHLHFRIDLSGPLVAADPRRKPLKVLRGVPSERAFPYDSDTPAIGGQPRYRPHVPRLIGAKLLVPELLARLRQTKERAFLVSMPKASMNEDGGLPPRKHKVGPAGEFRSMQSVAETLVPKVLPYLQLRPSVLSPDPRHQR